MLQVHPRFAPPLSVSAAASTSTQQRPTNNRALPAPARFCFPQVPFASSDKRTPNPTTPKQEFPSGGRGSSSFFAGPSPDGDNNNSFSHIDYVASYVAEGKAPPDDRSPVPRGYGGGVGVDPREAFDRQRDERAAISVLPSSPAAWSAEDDVNRGTGVRRRVSPRAAAGRAAAATAAAGGAGGRSPRRASAAAAGWAQAQAQAQVQVVSPARRQSTNAGNNDESAGLRPLALAFSDEIAAPAAAAAVAPGGRGKAGGREAAAGRGARAKNAGVAATSAAASAAAPAAAALCGRAAKDSPATSPAKVCGPDTTIGGGGAKGTAMSSPPAVVDADSASTTTTTTAGKALTVDTRAEAAPTRQVGLKCSTPLYDRSRNMLGDAQQGGVGRAEQEGQVVQPVTEKQGTGLIGEIRSGVFL